MGKLRKAYNSFRVILGDIGAPPLSAQPLPAVPPERARGVVFSMYKCNISRRVVAAQRQMLLRYVPADVAIVQLCSPQSHPQALNAFVRGTAYRTVVLLDIDCVPLRRGAIELLMDLAEAGNLAGASARTSHIQNNQHVFAGPYCMAFTMETYRKLGSPDFTETARGDVGEELTYAAEAKGVPVKLLWAVSTDEEYLWDLKDGLRFGRGTTFEGGFWHAFMIRYLENQRGFVTRVQRMLQESAADRVAGE